jgi:APA family basic amino acid/polyamine antiporter
MQGARHTPDSRNLVPAPVYRSHSGSMPAHVLDTPSVEPSTRAADADARLVRGIGVWTLAANAVNLTIGAGIFVLPGTVAAQMGAAGLQAYVVCAVAIGLILRCHAECGSRITRSGGPAAYVGAAFGGFPQFLVGMLLWAAWGLGSDAAVAAALADLAATVWPVLGAPAARAVFLLLVVASLVVLNVLGVRNGARVAALLTVLKIVPLAGLILLGLPAIRLEHLQGVTHTTAAQLGSTSLMLFFAFCGAETALVPSGEIVRPARTVPIAIVLALGTILSVYTGLQVVAQGVLGDALARSTEAPLAAVGAHLFGAFGRALMILTGAIAMVGLLAGDLLANPRAIFALAVARQLPAIFARVHPRFHTPWIAIATYGAMSLALAMSSAFAQLARASSAAILVIYAFVALATIQLRRRDVRSELPPLVTPGGWTVPLAALAVVGWLLAHTQRVEAIGLTVLIVLISCGYGVTKLTRR